MASKTNFNTNNLIGTGIQNNVYRFGNFVIKIPKKNIINFLIPASLAKEHLQIVNKYFGDILAPGTEVVMIPWSERRKQYFMGRGGGILPPNTLAVKQNFIENLRPIKISDCIDVAIRRKLYDFLKKAEELYKNGYSIDPVGWDGAFGSHISRRSFSVEHKLTNLCVSDNKEIVLTDFRLTPRIPAKGMNIIQSIFTIIYSRLEFTYMRNYIQTMLKSGEALKP